MSGDVGASDGAYFCGLHDAGVLGARCDCPPEESPAIGLHEAFDRVHDGAAQIIDAEKTALALFVQKDGQVRIKSPYSTEQVAGMLEQLAAKMRARTVSEPTL